MVKASTGTLGGRLSDRHGRRNALALGWCVYNISWAALGWAETVTALCLLALLYATSHGLVEGPEKALIAELAQTRARGTAFGAYNLSVGAAAFAASTTFGFVWDQFGDRVAFLASGASALLASCLLLWLVPEPPRPSTSASSHG